MIHVDVSPIAFSIGPFEVRWYGLMIAVAIIFLVWWLLRAARKQGTISADTIFTIAIIGIPSGIVGARLLHIVDRWDYYSQNPGQIIGAAGLTIFGAVLGTAAGLWVYSKFTARFKYGVLVDLLAPGIIVAQAIGRVGCLVNGCCYGITASFPGTIVYTNTSSFGPLGIPVLPTQVYEIAYDLIVFAILLKLRDRLRPDGSLFLVYLGFYAAWRLGIDYIRDGTPYLFGLHQAQVVSVVILAVAVCLLAYRTRWIKPEAGTQSLPAQQS